MLLFELLRTKQWYKNIVIFLPLIFVGQLFDISLYFKLILGFLALCFISSANYIFNDIKDFKHDSKLPEKRLRPIASKRISKELAISIAILLIIISLSIAGMLSFAFYWIIIALFGLTTLYTLYLKNETYLDVIAISINFVLRAFSGACLIQVNVSPWLILCPFFLAMFLATAKRDAELRFFSKEDIKVEKYSLEVTNSLMIITTCLLIASYSLFVVFTHNEILLLTLPSTLYLVLRYYGLTKQGSKICRNPELAYQDKRLFLGAIFTAILTIVLLYI